LTQLRECPIPIVNIYSCIPEVISWNNSEIGTVSTRHLRRHRMLKWALFFFIIAIIAGILGFTGIAAASVTIAKALFFIFLLICIVFVALAFFVGKSVLK
jgi:uncharacterized membrane protein YtjA (UPF0391 family)